MNFTSPRFKLLQAKWYRKLEKNGFEDIEYGLEEGMLKKTRLPSAYSWNWWPAFDYYRWAVHILHGTRFRSRRDREIWRLHAEGMSAAKIARLLGVNPRTARRRILRIERYLKRRGNQ